MTQINSTPQVPSNFVWAIGAFGAGGICAGVAFLVTHSLPLAALLAAIIVLCLLLGWWIGTISTQSQEPILSRPAEPPSPNQQVQIVSGAFDAKKKVSGNMRFARSAIEATPTPVIVIDQSGRMVITNQAARARFALNHSHLRFNQAVRRPDLIEAIEAVFVDRVPRSYAIESSVPVDRYERVSIAPFDARGSAYVMVSVQDETEIRMSERMRADFLANASHELRTPLAAIIGFIETLRGPARDDEVARNKFLEVMHVQADRMSRLISDLLSLSRIELNERVPPTTLSNLTSAVFEAIDSLTPEKKKRIVAPAHHEDVWILGDRDEMAQVISNLLDNALKYGGNQRAVRLQLASHLSREEAVNIAMRQWTDASRLPLTSPPVDRSRLYAVLRVEDQGDGIARQHLPRLSERFFRLEDTASGKSGTGLGLAIVKHIVSRHRGGLVVESELARGSAFAVYLPQPQAPAPLDPTV
jgi:two-component system, OmpR family, phosphate regulon sensor histidine kinase PhoR